MILAISLAKLIAIPANSNFFFFSKAFFSIFNLSDSNCSCDIKPFSSFAFKLSSSSCFSLSALLLATSTKAFAVCSANWTASACTCFLKASFSSCFFKLSAFSFSASLSAIFLSSFALVLAIDSLCAWNLASIAFKASPLASALAIDASTSLLADASANSSFLSSASLLSSISNIKACSFSFLVFLIKFLVACSFFLAKASSSLVNLIAKAFSSFSFCLLASLICLILLSSSNFSLLVCLSACITDSLTASLNDFTVSFLNLTILSALLLKVFFTMSGIFVNSPDKAAFIT